MVSRMATTLAATAALTLALPASATENVAQDVPPVDACSKNVEALGASMGHKADIAPDGRQIYRFVLRTAGLDYEVVCDAKTGVVGDVTPRMAQ